ncbi:zinc finger and BTB domain-containing protein 14-like [Eupeodes corollae]|uniref:zinc finger and BTB domain-containing protein 14-like n=1 Tax=Eupeodes corollae TaxID=290404 RepID=UPI002493C379|nr:zinc finger and BTB domain-containing protein 14-like [Eupeodes corollae]
MNNIEISGVCRCCLSQPITLNNLFSSCDNMVIAEAIENICGIDINPDSCLPDQICDDCLGCLKISYSLRIRTRQSDKTLHGILEGSIIAKEYSSEVDETEPNYCESIPPDIDSSHSHDDDDEETNGIAVEDLPITYEVEPVHSSGAGSQCPYCQKNFNHLKNLRTHMRRHFAEGKLTCFHCPNRYHTKFDLQRHMSKMHSDGFSYKCDLCDKEFPTKPECNRHVRSHDENKHFKCPVCGMEFKWKHNAQQHINAHEGKKPFFCDVCGKGFAFACKLKYHNKAKCKPSVLISVPKEEIF